MSKREILQKAVWLSRDHGVVSFCRDWRASRMPPLFWESDDRPLEEVERAPLIDFGDHSGYFIDDGDIVFLVSADRPGMEKWRKEGIYLAGNFNQWGKAVGDADWRMEAEEIGGREFFTLRMSKRYFSKWRKPIFFKFASGKGHWLDVPADAPNSRVDDRGNRNYEVKPQRTGRHQFVFKTPVSFHEARHGKLVFDDGTRQESIEVHPGVFIKSLDTDLTLGARVEGGFTVFRIFAPRASDVRLELFEPGDRSKHVSIPMTRADDVTWETKIPGNRHGWHYFYHVAGDPEEGLVEFDPEFPILDPYALACVGPHGPGIVVDRNRLPIPDRPFQPQRWHDLVIAEAHVRDLTEHAPVEMTPEERRGFSGLAKWVRHPDFYLHQLGVNAVELLPVQEFDTVDPEEYGWGYMPVNYFAPASQYALDPARGSQLEEFADLVSAFHERDMAVILDVVYNHVGVPNYLQYVDKEYFFMLDEQGNYLNHSGCGNTLDTETPMARRLIVESLTHLVRVFDVDGFRFDLGELLGKETLEVIERELKKVKPSLIFLAEPWSFRGHIAKDLKTTGVASWNDGYREFVKEYVLGHGNADGLRYFMQGSRDELTRFPAQTLNYVESHDDRCWIDKITENGGHNGFFPTPNDRRRTQLMTAILMMSAGIPMLSSGMDMLKSKHGVNNTYLRGDLNAIPYSRGIYFSGVQEYFCRWIQFRLSEAGRVVRLDGHPPQDYFASTRDQNAFAMLYNANRLLGDTQLIFAVNPHFDDRSIPVPGEDSSSFVQIADHERGPAHVLRPARIPIREGRIFMPPLSCALWIRKS